jgi:hypothetical protein
LIVNTQQKAAYDASEDFSVFCGEAEGGQLPASQQKFSA